MSIESYRRFLFCLITVTTSNNKGWPLRKSSGPYNALMNNLILYPSHLLDENLSSHGFPIIKYLLILILKRIKSICERYKKLGNVLFTHCSHSHYETIYAPEFAVCIKCLRSAALRGHDHQHKYMPERYSLQI